MQHVQQLTFVFVQTFYLNIKDGIGVDVDAFCFFDILRQCNFICFLDFHETTAEVFIFCVRQEFFQFCQFCNPAIANGFRDEPSQTMVGMEEPSSLGDTICFIIEFFRIQFIEVLQFLMFQNFCMERRNTVYGMAAHNGKVCHTNLTVGNDCHTTEFFRVHAVFCLQFQTIAAVDFFHNLIDTRQQTAEQFHGPFFQRFCHDGMVGVSAYLSGDFPSVIPRHIVFIHQHTHQFRNCYSRMGVVQLERHFIRQFVEIGVVFLETLHNALYRRGNEEILLTQTQFFPLNMFIGRVQHVCHGACQQFFFGCFLVIAFVEEFQIQFILRPCFPQTQCIYGVIAIADNRIVIRHSDNRLIIFLYETVFSVAFGHSANIAAEFDFYSVFISLDAPRVAVFQPVIGRFHLITVFDFLFKNTIVVADTAAISRQLQCGQGIQETCSQTPQTAVTQTRIGFRVLYHIVINAKFFQNFSDLIIHFQIDQAVAEKASHQKFHGQVVNHLHVFFVIFIVCFHPFVGDNVANCKHGSLVNFLGRGCFQCFTIQSFDVFPNHFFQCFFIQ